jgi:hypothetical protein
MPITTAIGLPPFSAPCCHSVNSEEGVPCGRTVRSRGQWLTGSQFEPGDGALNGPYTAVQLIGGEAREVPNLVALTARLFECPKAHLHGHFELSQGAFSESALP